MAYYNKRPHLQEQCEKQYYTYTCKETRKIQKNNKIRHRDDKAHIKLKKKVVKTTLRVIREHQNNTMLKQQYKIVKTLIGKVKNSLRQNKTRVNNC